ncbi:MAG: tetratricopeptide repeat protein [Alphaproteobacteria bacterium]|nr:tetratricopeptide repeat protein [Alphaproteobacteria bacterium]MDP6563841.1 tetratricopeptide repeat protein [Alphaproteobacteria bacterium]MDP6811722.1 tetratricopeptide repeat protein [Alphaproteobacteria bacterium]
MLLLSLCLVTVSGAAATDKRPMSERLMYGKMDRAGRAGQYEPPDAAAAKKVDKTVQFASNRAVDLGWQYLSRGDHATAMKRFNQAWGLNPGNGRAYWGFAVILYTRDKDLAGAVKMFEWARRLVTDDPALFVDYGRILETGGRPRDAIPMFEAALAMDEKIPPAYFGLVKAYLGIGDARKALHYAKKGRKMGTQFSDSEIEYLQELADKQPN